MQCRDLNTNMKIQSNCICISRGMCLLNPVAWLDHEIYPSFKILESLFLALHISRKLNFNALKTMANKN